MKMLIFLLATVLSTISVIFAQDQRINLRIDHRSMIGNFDKAPLFDIPSQVRGEPLAWQEFGKRFITIGESRRGTDPKRVFWKVELEDGKIVWAYEFYFLYGERIILTADKKYSHRKRGDYLETPLRMGTDLVIEEIDETRTWAKVYELVKNRTKDFPDKPTAKWIKLGNDFRFVNNNDMQLFTEIKQLKYLTRSIKNSYRELSPALQKIARHKMQNTHDLDLLSLIEHRGNSSSIAREENVLMIPSEGSGHVRKVMWESGKAEIIPINRGITGEDCGVYHKYLAIGTRILVEIPGQYAPIELPVIDVLHESAQGIIGLTIECKENLFNTSNLDKVKITYLLD